MKFSPNENVLRVALIVFSVIFGILSISLIALGVVYIDELWWPKHYVGLDFLELPTLLIILGSLSLIMAIGGCFCAKTYNRKLLLAFAMVLLVILCVELAISVIAFINFDEHEGGNSRTYRLMLKQYNSGNNEDLMVFHELEEHYNCCGVTGFESNCTEIFYDYYNDLANETSTPDPYFVQSGCAAVVDEHIQLVAIEIGYISVVFALLQDKLQMAEIGYVYLIQRLIK